MSLQGWASQAEAPRDVSLKGAFYCPKMSLKTFVSTLNLKGQKLQQIQNDTVSQEEEEEGRVKPMPEVSSLPGHFMVAISRWFCSRNMERGGQNNHIII